MLRSRWWKTPSVWWLGLPAAVVAVAMKAPQLRSSNEVRVPHQEATVPRRIAYVDPQAIRYPEPRPLPATVTLDGVPLASPTLPTPAATQTYVAPHPVAMSTTGESLLISEPLLGHQMAAVDHAQPLEPFAEEAPWPGPEGAGPGFVANEESLDPAPQPLIERPELERVFVDCQEARPEPERVLVSPTETRADLAPESIVPEFMRPEPQRVVVNPEPVHPQPEAGVANAGEVQHEAGPPSHDVGEVQSRPEQTFVHPGAEWPTLEGGVRLPELPPSANFRDAEQGVVLPPSDWSALPSVQLPPQVALPQVDEASPVAGDPPYANTHPSLPQIPTLERPFVPADPTGDMQPMPMRSAPPLGPPSGVARRFGAPPADPLAVLPGVSNAALREQMSQHVTAGYRLAQRGALYSAKREFESALRVLAQSQDVVAGTSDRTQQLAAALSAIEEADELFVSDPRTQATVNPHQLAAAHRTPVLRDTALENVTQLQAIQAYYGFAQSSLTSAVGSHPAAGEALYGLGKIYAALAQQPTAHNGRLLAAKAMLMYQVALAADARHHLAANELGVMLARYGQYDEAKKALLQSVALQSLPQSWHNLAMVHRQLGEQPLAELAEIEARAAAAQKQLEARPLIVQAASDGGLQWIDVEEAMRQASQTAKTSPAPPANGPPGDRSASTSNSVWKWLPWKTAAQEP